MADQEILFRVSGVDSSGTRGETLVGGLGTQFAHIVYRFRLHGAESEKIRTIFHSLILDQYVSRLGDYKATFMGLGPMSAAATADSQFNYTVYIIPA